MASVGQPGGETGIAGDSGSGSSGASGDTSGTATSSDGTTMASGGGTTTGGTTMTSGGAQGSSNFGRVPILVTAGNAVLDVAGRADAARGPLNDNLPNSAPVTGTVTQLLGDTGQALVRAGDGSAYLVDSLIAAPGSAVTIAAGNGHLVGGPGSNPLLGVSVISPTQTAGSVASVGVGSNGTLLTANVPGNPALVGVPAAVTGATGNLANATVGNTQVVGGSQPAAIGVSALSPTQATGTVLTAGAASGGNLVTVNGTSVAAPSTGNPLAGNTPVSGAVAGTTGAVGAVTGGLADVTVGTTQIIGGQPAAIGVSALSPTQTSGSLVTAGVASGGNLATLNGTTLASPTGGNLLGGTPTSVPAPAVSASAGTIVGGRLGLH